MLAQSFKQEILESRFSRKYLALAGLYGLTTLIIPLAIQYLVNSLALSSLLANTFVFMVIVLLFLLASQVLKYVQLIVLEYMQREIFVREMRRWFPQTNPKKTHYMLEVAGLMKSYSTAWGHVSELALSLGFGLLVVVTLNPVYLVIPVIILGAIAGILYYWRPALKSSIEESNAKYKILEKKYSGGDLSDDDLCVYLEKRDDHFLFIKRSTLIASSTLILSQLILLGLGIYLIETSRLSVGQLVAAEIILSGIMMRVSKLPKTLEALYDFETSRAKLDYALKGSHED